jgi:diamine N-acetyltransferase
MLITQVNSDDLKVIQSMAQVIWNQHYPEIIGQEQVDYMLDRMYDLASLRKQQENGHIFFKVAKSSENMGFISVVAQEKGWFLNKLYVMPNAQRLGIGKLLLEYVIQKFDIQEFRLQVNRQNYKAINFYFKNGFEIERVADFDIGDGYQMNDFIMIWKKSAQ